MQIQQQINATSQKKTSNRGRPSNRVFNHQPSQSWTGNDDCKELMSIISRNCTFHYRYFTGIKALQLKDQGNDKGDNFAHNVAKDRILKLLKLPFDLKYLLLKKHKNLQAPIQLDKSGKIIDDEVKCFVIQDNLEIYQKILEILNLIRKQIDTHNQEAFQKIFDIFVTVHQEYYKQQLLDEDVNEDFYINCVNRCLEYMINNKKKFDDFFKLQLIKEFIKLHVQTKDIQKDMNCTQSNHREQKDEKFKMKFLDFSNNQLNNEEEQELIKDFRVEIETENRLLKQFLKQIFENWEAIIQRNQQYSI